MALRVLLIVALALAGCMAKSTDQSSQDPAQVLSSSSQSPLGSGGGSMGTPSVPEDQATGQGASDAPSSSSAIDAAGSPGSVGAQGTSSSGSPTTGTTPSGTTSASSTTTASASTTASSTTSLTPTVPPVAPPAQVVHACTITLAGLHGLGPIPSYVGSCSPSSFASSTGAAFTHAGAQVVSSASAVPTTATVQVKDASGNVVGSTSGMGTQTITLPSPSAPSATYTVVAMLGGVFTDYQATVTITLS